MLFELLQTLSDFSSLTSISHTKGPVFYCGCLAFKVLNRKEKKKKNTADVKEAGLCLSASSNVTEKFFNILCSVASNSQRLFSEHFVSMLFMLVFFIKVASSLFSLHGDWWHMCSSLKIRKQNEWIKVVHWSDWFGHSRQSFSQLVATLHCLLSSLAHFSSCEVKREAFGLCPNLLYHSCSAVTHQAVFTRHPGVWAIDEGLSVLKSVLR